MSNHDPRVFLSEDRSGGADLRSLEVFQNGCRVDGEHHKII
jgi:hypothetical protein